MIKVSIVTAEMRGINGANRVTEKIISGYDLFLKNNIMLNNLYTDSTITKCNEYVSTLGSYSNEYLKKRSIIEKLKKLPFYKLKIIQCYLQRKVIRHSEIATKKYLSNCDDSNVIIFQDIFCAYHFLKSNKRKDIKTLFITHTDTDPLEHFLMNRPQIKKTRTEKLIRAIYNFVFTHCDKVVSICPQAENFIKENYGILPACIINGIEDTVFLKDYSKNGNKKNIVILGTITYRKGQDLVVNAILNMKEIDRDKLIIHFVGKGDLLEELKRKVEINGLQNCIVFHGEIKNVSELLSNMDAMILPSRADTVPISIIEGLRAGIPVFATPNGEVPKMVDGCGELFNPSVECVIEILSNIANNKYNLKDLGINARLKYKTNYNIEKMIEKYTDVILSLEKE